MSLLNDSAFIGLRSSTQENREESLPSTSTLADCSTRDTEPQTGTGKRFKEIEGFQLNSSINIISALTKHRK